jgi:hypothetical protein
MYKPNDKVKQRELGRICSMHGSEDDCLLGFGSRGRRKEIIKEFVE